MKFIVNKPKYKQIQSKFKLSDGTVTTNRRVVSQNSMIFVEIWTHFCQENSKSNSICLALYG